MKQDKTKQYNLDLDTLEYLEHIKENILNEIYDKIGSLTGLEISINKIKEKYGIYTEE